MSPMPLIASSICITDSASAGQISEAKEYVAMFNMADAIPKNKKET